MKKITKIVTFYDDGTFTEFTPSLYMPQPYIPPAPLNPSPYPWTAPQWPQNPWYTVTSSDRTDAPQTKETKK